MNTDERSFLDEPAVNLILIRFIQVHPWLIRCCLSPVSRGSARARLLSLSAAGCI